MHGTGTPLGDPIEVGALGQGLAGDKMVAQPLALLSNKASFGHTEGTAGGVFCKAVQARKDNCYTKRPSPSGGASPPVCTARILYVYVLLSKNFIYISIAIEMGRVCVEQVLPACC